jgi:hypothetical protein
LEYEALVPTELAGISNEWLLAKYPRTILCCKPLYTLVSGTSICNAHPFFFFNLASHEPEPMPLCSSTTSQLLIGLPKIPAMFHTSPYDFGNSILCPPLTCPALISPPLDVAAFRLSIV